MGALTPVGINP